MTYATTNEAVQEMLDPFIGYWPHEAKYPDVKNKNVPPKTPANWARVTVLHADDFQSTLSCINGKRRWTKLGVLMIQIFTPAGSGNSVAYSLADAVKNVYKTYRSPGGMWFRNPRHQEIGDDGMYSQINVLVDFQYEQII